MLHVHILHPPDVGDLEHLHSLLEPEVALTAGPDLPDPAVYHILIAGRPQPEHLQASPHLHTVIVPWAGIPGQTRDLLREHFPHLRLYNLHHNAAPVAELAMALLLAAAKFIVPLDQALRRADWSPRYARSQSALLDGKTALVLGYGSIGRRVARACRGLGMQVLATRRQVEELTHDDVAEIHPATALPTLLPRTGALLICLPLTPETKGLIGAEELAALPAGALLVNIGRGEIIEEEALYRALESGQLRAAGLDVWYNYPEDEAARKETRPAHFPFHQLDNVVMSPHRGGSTDETGRLRMAALARLLNALARGEPAPNQVNLEHGY